MNETNLKEIEKKTYMSYHQDGLLDIFIGVYALLFGLGILLSTVAGFSTGFVVPAIFPAIMVPIWISAKKRITMPRIGYVRVGHRGVNKLMAVFIGLTVVGLGAFMVLTLASRSQGWALMLRDLIVPNGMVIIGVGAAMLSSLFAYSMRLKRLYAYGLLALLLLIAGHIIPIPLAYLLIVIAAAIIINGSLLLVRFMRKYRPTGDEPNAEESH